MVHVIIGKHILAVLFWEQTNQWDTREFSITLRYKFNTTKSKYKGTGAANDELRRL